MSKTFKVGRLGATYCWRIGSLQHASSLCCLQKRYYAGRYTFDDMTQSRINAIYTSHSDAEIPRENPWKSNYPSDLNDIGYESHCNDRVYMAKNNHRYNQQEYDQWRHERRTEAQNRIKSHFIADQNKGQTEMRKRAIMQDPAEHQKRQQDIIEMNRRLWQSRPQVKREINLSGITYRPDLQKQLRAYAHRKSQDGDDMRYQPRSEGETEADAETDWWVRKQSEGESDGESADSISSRRVRGLMGKNNPYSEGERTEWRTNSQPRGSPLQRRLQELMEGEKKPDGAECDWRVKTPRARAEEGEECDWRVKSPRAAAEEGEECDWRVKTPRAAAEEGEECDWRVKTPRAGAEEGEECDWRVKKSRGRTEPDWRTNAWKPEGEECDWRVKTPRAGAEEGEECDWRVKTPRAGPNEPDWRVKQSRGRTNAWKPEGEECDWRNPGGEECDWRVKPTKAEGESQDWRLKSRRTETEDWRVRSSRSDAEDDDWQHKSWQTGRPMRSQSMDTTLQKRLTQLMEGEKKPEIDECDWRTQDTRAEWEDSHKMEAQLKADAEDRAWKARRLSPVYDPNRDPKSWQKKHDHEIESQYWHSWHSCPDNQEPETTVELKPHQRRKKFSVQPPSHTRGGQKRSYHHTALYPQPLETQPEPLAYSPLPKRIRVIPKKQKKSNPKRKREGKIVQPPRFKMTIKTRALVSRRPVPGPVRRLQVLSEVAGPSFNIDNLNDTFVDGRFKA